MDAQANSDARIIREQLTALEGWIAHWKDDVECRQVCSLSGLILAQSHVENALAVLDRMQAEHKAAA